MKYRLDRIKLRVWKDKDYQNMKEEEKIEQKNNWKSKSWLGFILLIIFYSNLMVRRKEIFFNSPGSSMIGIMLEFVGLLLLLLGYKYFKNWMSKNKKGSNGYFLSLISATAMLIIAVYSVSFVQIVILQRKKNIDLSSYRILYKSANLGSRTTSNIMYEPKTDFGKMIINGFNNLIHLTISDALNSLSKTINGYDSYLYHNFKLIVFEYIISDGKAKEAFQKLYTTKYSNKSHVEDSLRTVRNAKAAFDGSFRNYIYILEFISENEVELYKSLYIDAESSLSDFSVEVYESVKKYDLVLNYYENFIQWIKKFESTISYLNDNYFDIVIRKEEMKIIKLHELENSLNESAKELNIKYDFGIGEFGR